MTGTLTITLLSDACFSMPATRNVSVDTEACTDELGLPRIPGKTLRGLLRDTWLSASPALDPDQSRGYALLGKPRSHDQPGALRIGDALMPASVRSRVAWATQRKANPLPLEAVREAFYDTRVLTSINRETGAPRTDTLRGIRVVPRGTVLEAPIAAVGDVDAAFLDLLLALTRHAGMDRNRGMGLVRMSVKWHKDAVAPRGAGKSDLGHGEWLHYRLTLRAPCLLHSDNLDPNSCATLPYIAGSTIRGAVASALRRRGDQAALAALLSGGVATFSNAYPEANGRRSIPTPCSWQRDKRSDVDPDRDLQLTHPADAVAWLFGDHDPPEYQQQGLGTEMVVTDGSSFTPVAPAINQNTHQRRKREKGISEKNNTTVYVYEALAPGQSFRGSVWAPCAHHAVLRSVLEGGDIWLGKSARSGYGGDPAIEILELPFGDDELERPTPPEILLGEMFVVWLTSNACLRDPSTGQHDPWRLGPEVDALLGGCAKVVAACVRASTARGYIRELRTELPCVPCVSGGSLVVMRARRDIEGAEVARFQSRTIGERIADGYGRLCIARVSGDGTGMLSARVLPEGPPPAEPSGSPTETERAAQKLVYEQLARRILRDYAVLLADEAQGDVTSSLAQRLRVPLRSSGWQQTYRDWFGTDRARALKETALNQCLRLRLRSQSLKEFILAVCLPQWQPDLPTAGAVAAHRMLPKEDAERVWSEVVRDLRPVFLDQLLGQLSRRAKKTPAGKER